MMHVTKVLKKERSVVFGVFAVLLFLLVGFFYTQDNEKKDAEIVFSLQETVLPFIEENEVSTFIDMDWCKGMRYGSRAVVEVSNGAESNPCLTHAETFSEGDWSIFNTLKSKLQAIPQTKFRQIGTEHPLTRPEHALFPEKSLGVAFSIDCFFCRTRYVYWPNYSQLPPDIDAEIVYTPINGDWYRVDQDWN